MRRKKTTRRERALIGHALRRYKKATRIRIFYGDAVIFDASIHQQELLDILTGQPPITLQLSPWGYPQ